MQRGLFTSNARVELEYRECGRFMIFMKSYSFFFFFIMKIPKSCVPRNIRIKRNKSYMEKSRKLGIKYSHFFKNRCFFLYLVS